MVRGPKSGNGTRSPVYYLDSAGLVPLRSRARALYSQADPLGAGMLANGSLNSATLNRFLVHGVSLTGLGGAVTFDSIGALVVPRGGTTRQITVTVIWQLPEQPAASGNPGIASKLEVTYGMSVVDLQSGKWYVKEIGASTEAVGAR